MQQFVVIWPSFFIYKNYIIKTSKEQQGVAKNIKKEFRIKRIKISIIEMEEKKMKKYGKITGILLSVVAVILSIFMSTQFPTVNP